MIVGLLFSNGWQFVVTYLAILRTGHIALPLDPTFKQLELDAIIKQVSPVIIVTDENYDDKISVGKKILFSQLQRSGKTAKPGLRLSAEKQIASLTFTSGTTGRPKLAPYTHANHVWNIEVCSKVWNWTTKDKLLTSLPLSHWYGLVLGLSGGLYHGNSFYIDSWFDAKQTLERLAGGQISLFTHVPLVYAEMLKVTGDYDLRATRLLISGGAPLPPAVAERFKERFGVDILECYGSSESGRIAANSAADHQSGSPGNVLPEVKIKLDADGQVLIKSKGVFPGYYNNPLATQANFDKDGWWQTGDLAELQGRRLYLKGRVQEKIRRFGYSLSPRDIEWALYNFDKIRSIHVMGRQRSDQPNDELIYFLDTSASNQEIEAYCKANLPYAWRPDKLVFLSAIPKTRSGKTRIAELQAMLDEPAAIGGRH